MSIVDQLNADMKEAMRNKEKTKLSVIRMVKSSLQNEQIKTGKELSEEEVITVLSREMKQRKDSLHEFQKAGRDDLASNVEVEIGILEHYLPEQLSEDELKQLIAQTINDVNATSKADMGKVMGALMPKVKGKADGGLVNKLVQEALS